MISPKGEEGNELATHCCRKLPAESLSLLICSFSSGLLHSRAEPFATRHGDCGGA